MYWGDVFTSPLFFINFPAYKNYTLTSLLKQSQKDLCMMV